MQRSSIGPDLRAHAGQRETFRSAIACSSDENSTPTTRRKGSVDARSTARPLPEPRSTKVKSSQAAPSCLRISPKSTSGPTPWYSLPCIQLADPTSSSLSGMTPLVSTPNRRSNASSAIRRSRRARRADGVKARRTRATRTKLNRSVPTKPRVTRDFSSFFRKDPISRQSPFTRIRFRHPARA